jgi:hypothetical protein
MAHVKLYTIEESKERAKNFIDNTDKFVSLTIDESTKQITVQIGNQSFAEMKAMIDALNYHITCIIKAPIDP